jgi:hypothetical protein
MYNSTTHAHDPHLHISLLAAWLQYCAVCSALYTTARYVGTCSIDCRFIFCFYCFVQTSHSVMPHEISHTHSCYYRLMNNYMKFRLYATKKCMKFNTHS